MRMKYLKTILFIVWLGIIGAAIYFYQNWEIPLSDYPGEIRDWLDMIGGWGPLAYIVMYMARPLILMPATILTITAGLAFGPIWGLLYVIIASNLSASFGFLLGRFFGHKLVKDTKSAFIQKINKRAEKNGFITVLLMRLLYLPFDFTNIGCGISTVRYRDYALGSFLGMLSGSVSFVLLGGAAGSAVGIDADVSIDPMTKTWITLGVSLIFFVGGLILSKYLAKRNQDLVALKETS